MNLGLSHIRSTEEKMRSVQKPSKEQMPTDLQSRLGIHYSLGKYCAEGADFKP